MGSKEKEQDEHEIGRRDLMEVLAASKPNSTVAIAQNNSLYKWQVIRNWLDQMSVPDEVSRQIILKKEIKACIRLLEAKHVRYAQMIRLRYEEGLSVEDAAKEMSLELEPSRRLRTNAVNELYDVLLAQERKAQAARLKRMRQDLGVPTYDRLFGIEEIQKKVFGLLVGVDSSHVVSLIGMGGIGKSTIAQSVALQLIDHDAYDRVIWVSVEHAALSAAQKLNTTLTYLARLLFERLFPNQAPPNDADTCIKQVRTQIEYVRYLIIIDNIEAKLDRSVLNALHAWSKPSRFLLTSRLHLDSDVGVQNVRVPELAFDAALAMFRHQATLCDVDLPTTFDAAFKPIYEIVAGNPYALKLTVSLLQHLDVQKVTADFAQARTQNAKQLYHHIFRQVWANLSSDARELLETMTIFSTGGSTFDEMEGVSKLDEKALNEAILELHQSALLERQVKEAAPSTYFIHSLTRTFVQIKANWPGALDDD